MYKGVFCIIVMSVCVYVHACVSKYVGVREYAYMGVCALYMCVCVPGYVCICVSTWAGHVCIGMCAFMYICVHGCVVCMCVFVCM